MNNGTVPVQYTLRSESLHNKSSEANRLPDVPTSRYEAKETPHSEFLTYRMDLAVPCDSLCTGSTTCRITALNSFFTGSCSSRFHDVGVQNDAEKNGELKNRLKSSSQQYTRLIVTRCLSSRIITLNPIFTRAEI